MMDREYFSSIYLLIALLAIVFSVFSQTEIKKIDLNHASKKELESIPGIGPSYAARITNEREKRQGFRSVTDLLKVRGIGRKLLERIKPYIVITAYDKASCDSSVLTSRVEKP